MDPFERARLLANPDALGSHIADVLFSQTSRAQAEMDRYGTSWSASAVLFLIRDPVPAGPGLSLILNKRSEAVPQPGDLCCPGGGVSRRTDSWLARVAQLPFMPMGRWSHRRLLSLRDENRRTSALLVATALREGFEEMRLTPSGVTFLGLLPAQQLRLLRRAIHPVVARLDRAQRFRPNWEVEQVVAIELKQLLDPNNYARLRVRFTSNEEANERLKDDLPCYRHKTTAGHEILWGATFHITVRFLERVFEFVPPPFDDLPLERVTLDESYMTGRAAYRAH